LHHGIRNLLAQCFQQLALAAAVFGKQDLSGGLLVMADALMEEYSSI
jgi:hypothetical protein